MSKLYALKKIVSDTKQSLARRQKALAEIKDLSNKDEKSTEMVFLDVETAPSLGWVWGKWEQNVIDFKNDWYVLSFAARWKDSKKIIVRGLCDYPSYESDKENDKELITELWDILDKADIVIAHNGDSFDIPKINTRFISHKIEPPSPYKTVDTLKVARQKFKFDSNKLDELGRYLGVGRKLPHTGFYLWRGCMAGDSKSWHLMKRYNSHDIVLLEKVYYLMLPWISNHPNVNKGQFACPKCGSINVMQDGFSYTLLRQKQRYCCKSCHGWFEGSARKVE